MQKLCGMQRLDENSGQRPQELKFCIDKIVELLMCYIYIYMHMTSFTI